MKTKRFPHLRNAPIHEALIDIRLSLPPNFDVKKFLTIKSKLKSKYPMIDERWELTGEIEFAPTGSSQSMQRKSQGYWFKNQEGTKIVQFRNNGFTFNKLRPYSSWSEILKEAKRTWNLYSAIIGRQSIVRLAVRYINHIHLPLPLPNMSQYLVLCPTLPGQGQGSIKGFMNRIVIEEPSIGGETIVTQASQQGASKDSMRILFDIDTSKRIEDNEQLKESDVWKILDELRKIKNRIFFANVTRKTIEMYR